MVIVNSERRSIKVQLMERQSWLLSLWLFFSAAPPPSPPWPSLRLHSQFSLSPWIFFRYPIFSSFCTSVLLLSLSFLILTLLVLLFPLSLSSFALLLQHSSFFPFKPWLCSSLLLFSSLLLSSSFLSWNNWPQIKMFPCVSWSHGFSLSLFLSTSSCFTYSLQHLLHFFWIFFF